MAIPAVTMEDFPPLPFFRTAIPWTRLTKRRHSEGLKRFWKKKKKNCNLSSSHGSFCLNICPWRPKKVPPRRRWRSRSRPPDGAETPARNPRPHPPQTPVDADVLHKQLESQIETVGDFQNFLETYRNWLKFIETVEFF